MVLLGAGLLLAALVNLSLGSVTVPPAGVFASLTGGPVADEAWRTIVVDYRLPKALTAALAGGALSVSGLLMQTFFRNPLAGPFVLGISSGASLGVAVLVLGGGLLGEGFVAATAGLGPVVAATLGSTALLTVVLAVAYRVRDAMTVLIVGLMFGSMTGALVGGLSVFAPAGQLQRYVLWGLGSLGSLGWGDLAVLGTVVAVGLGLATASLKALNLLLLGEDYARSAGLALRRSRALILLATGLLAGGVTAYAGPIAFVGLAVPHLTRQLVRTADHRVLGPAVFLTGAVLLLLCDTLAQLPGTAYVLPINAVTAVAGAPVVIWLLLRRKMLF